MKNILKVAGASLVGFSMLAGTALAVNIPALAIFNGDTEVFAKPNATFTVTPRVEVETGEVAHAIATDVIGDSRPMQCHDISNIQGEQWRNVSVSDKAPSGTDAYGFEIRVYYTTGVNAVAEANSKTGDSACTGSYDLAYNQNDVVNVTPNGSSSTDDTNVGGMSSAEFQALLAAIKAVLNPTPTAPAACAELTAKMTGTSYGVYNDANVSLQGFLLSKNPNSIPALKAGSTIPMGFYGPQTAAAISAYKAVNGCN